VVSSPLENAATPLYRKLSAAFLAHVTCTGSTFSYPHKRFLIPHPTRLALNFVQKHVYLLCTTSYNHSASSHGKYQLVVALPPRLA